MAYNPKYNQTTYKYAKENYKRVPLDLPKADYEEVKHASEAAGESVNGYIKTAIRERINRDTRRAEKSGKS